MSIKPEGWMHAYYPPNNPQKFWQFRNTPAPRKDGTGEIKALYAIPDTHRVVPVELLRRVMTGCTEAQCEDVRAIIEDKPCSQS